MKNNAVEPFEKVIQLRAELGQYHNTHLFDSCQAWARSSSETWT
jgi:hypothetical protein